MPVIFLSECKSSKKKVPEENLSENGASIITVPFRKMRKKALRAFKEKLSALNLPVFSEESLKPLVPERLKDPHNFFNSLIPEILYPYLKEKGISFKKLVVVTPTVELSKELVNQFREIAFYGENALHSANALYEATGASVPIVSGTDESDVIFYTKDYVPLPAAFKVGFSLPEKENVLISDNLKFYPLGEYANLPALLKRPLDIREAAIISEYDKKTSFNIAFEN